MRKIMRGKKIVGLIVVFFLLYGVICAAKPFWNRYWLAQDVEVAALHGTKNSIEDTRSFLTELMDKNARGFSGKDFDIEKDENNNVTVSITYEDEIRLFGITLTTLELTVEKTRSEVEERF
jgi:hypothetical protein